MPGPERRLLRTLSRAHSGAVDAADYSDVRGRASAACVADVARRHDISTARIYTWRNKLRPQLAGPQFAEAVVDIGDVELPVSEPWLAIIVEVGCNVRMTVFPSAPAALVTLVMATLKALR